MKIKIDGKEFDISEAELKKLICSADDKEEQLEGSRKEDIEGLDFVIIRSRDAGVFAGYLNEDFEDGRVKLYQAIRIWYWEGAFTLSEMALKGVSSKDECKFAIAVPNIIIQGVCEIIECTEKARINLQSVIPYKTN